MGELIERILRKDSRDGVQWEGEGIDWTRNIARKCRNHDSGIAKQRLGLSSHWYRNTIVWGFLL